MPRPGPKTVSAGGIFAFLASIIGWGLVLLLAMCILVTLQSTGVLSWMVP